MLPILQILKNNWFTIGCILFYIASLLWAYKSGEYKANLSNSHKLQALHIESLYKAIEIERAYRVHENDAIRQYIGQIEELKQAHEKELEDLKASNLRDTVVIKSQCVSKSNKGGSTGTSVPAKTGTKPDLRCYTESELLAKIKRSMDITGECDQLAVKYNSLLKLYKNE